MKLFIVLVALGFTAGVESAKNNQWLRPNLPVGPFKIDIKRIIPCDAGKKNKIQMNFYLSKTSATTTVIKGNFSLFGTSFNDNYNIRVNFDILDSTGGWSDNSIVFKKDKACSVAQSFFKEGILQEYSGINGCPVNEGVYMVTGVPGNNVENILTNIPKNFFYGTYKLRVQMMDKEYDEEISCMSPVVEIKRPWET